MNALAQNAGTTTHRLDQLFRPRSVAIVGASAKPGPRNRILTILMKHGFAGRIYPVTPTHTEVEGLKAYPTVGDLPEAPDVVLIITPAETVPAILEECGVKGIKAAIVYSSGFEEVDGGQLLADKLAAVARKYGIALLGANGQGLWSIKAKTMLTFGGAAYALEELQHSRIAIVSQSGALAGAIGLYLQRNGLGCSYIASVGNETCMDALDVLDWVVDQQDVGVVGLYLEGLGDASRLLALAERARSRGVQIVALKAGRSGFGQEATASHTGKIASPYAIYLDVLAQAGVIVVDSLSECMAALEALSCLADPRQSRNARSGVAILSSSGGAGALLADHGEENGLPMSTFADTTVSRLVEILPEFARKTNPVDLTGQVRGNPNLFRDSLEVLQEDEQIEAVVIQFSSSGQRDLRDNADVFKAAAAKGMPIVISFAIDTMPTEIKVEFREHGILICSDPGESMRALGWVYQRRNNASLPKVRTAPTNQRAAPATWEETMAYLEDCNVPAATWTILKPEDGAAQACSDMKYPLVVKVLPDDAEHKTELGLVELRVQTPEDVDYFAASFRKKMGKPEAGILVQEMITDGVEVVLACLKNTDFGPVLSIGSGGVAIELYRDVTYLSLPVTAEQVETSLKKLKVWALLEGFRGAPRADIPALIEAAVRFGDVVLATSELVEAEINPVLVRPEGKGLAAVDFLGKTAGAQAAH